VGAIALFVSTMLHPLGADPDDAPAAFAEYGTNTLYVWTHVGQFVGFASVGVALVGLAATLESSRASAWGRIGVTGAAASMGLAAALQAVHGVALKTLVDRWVAAAGDARVLAFEAAFAVRQIEIGLAAYLSFTLGFTVSVFGVAIFFSKRYPLWFGAIGLLGGLGTVAAGAAQASTGFSPFAMTQSTLSSSILLVWAMLAGALMWRLAHLAEE